MIARRRFLMIAASCIATPAMAAGPQQWTGQALGASACVVLSGAAPQAAQRVFAKVEMVLRQVEAQFSLYCQSSLVRLNRDGWLTHPDKGLRDVCDEVDAVHEATSGIFDPSIQPLWLAVANSGDVVAAKSLIGWQRVRRSPNEIRLDYGMQLTFNGIAQGYAADCIAALMQAEGFGDVLIDIGEVVALGERPGGGGWKADITLPDGSAVARMALSGRALATSSPSGTLIGDSRPHIINPLGTAPRWRLASVSAPTAALADALSTAFCLMDQAAIDRALQYFPQARIEALV